MHKVKRTHVNYSHANCSGNHVCSFALPASLYLTTFIKFVEIRVVHTRKYNKLVRFSIRNWMKYFYVHHYDQCNSSQLRAVQVTNGIIIPPTQRSCWEVHWFHSVRPSVRPSRIPCPLCIIYSSEWIFSIFSTNDQ